MQSLMQKFVLSSASLMISFGFSTAEAATISYDLAGEIETGEPSLIGETYSGILSFDDVSRTVQSITFNFLGSTFTEADADITPTVAFDGDMFLGVDYTVTVTNPAFVIEMFTLSSGFFDRTDALFDYIPRVGTAGIGGVTYTLSSTATVPEPSLTGGLLILGVSSLIANNKQRKKKQP
jgi:hypothetical protein